jgi:hypothetical protein
MYAKFRFSDSSRRAHESNQQSQRARQQLERKPGHCRRYDSQRV